MVVKEIPIAPMKQLQEAVSEQDDWTGVTNSATRRKLQNRLHQRAWRRRKSTRLIATTTTHQEKEQVCQQYGNHQFTSNYDPPPSTDTQLLLLPKKPYVSPYTADRNPMKPNSLAAPYLNIQQKRRKHDKQIAPLLQYYDSANQNHSSLPVIFPLAPNHHLITLVQYNVLRATVTNFAILNILHTIPTECSIALNLGPSYDPPETIPPTLYPTPTQLAIPHEPWIDIYPCAQMRDNLILNEGNYDPDELCFDTAGGLWEGFDYVEVRGMMIWGEPWNEDGWEVTQGFVDKWGWILKGCDKMIEISNRWREGRGEERLVVEV